MNEPRPGVPGSLPPLSSPHTVQRTANAPLRPSIVPPPMSPVREELLEPISLIEEIETPPIPAPQSVSAPPPPTGPKKITAFGADVVHKQHQWKRQPVKTGNGAIRVKSFHGKYSEQGLEYLDNAINEWLDNNPHVEIKFVTPTVMTFEGKIREPALVLNVWY